ncbi:alpha-amylase [Nanobdella aerobiophila]|uniref:Alpha-amylase n=1 Tax=Nanobdella aerobiophila TaxID=2586965 RepID=A0A915SZH9_9ARCH|nr:glycoside hydrolase family 57 protein [Nanobdella aerobiophila]BBL45259.1 alpha-amylase [Nanobdella aerobiophila]
MSGIIFYFHAHQPRRTRYYSFFDIGSKDYFNDNINKRILDRVVNKSYKPALEMIYNNCTKYDLKFSFSISGTLIEQLELYHPEILELWKRLVDTGNVEIVSETYFHSISYLIDKKEFIEQIKMHKKKIKELFNYNSRSFRNFELVFNNDIGNIVYNLGFETALTEGADSILGWKSPNYVYKLKGNNLRLLLRNYKLSDDIAFRFGNRNWEEYPLTADKYYEWIKKTPGDIINIFMDFETIGEHIWPETGIFNFWNKLLEYIGKNKEIETYTINEASNSFEVKDEISIENLISWADIERDLSAWMGDNIQKEAIEYLKEIYEKNKDNQEVMKVLRYLTTSDNFYYMSLKYNADGDVHKYFREEAFATPYDSFISYMNILRSIDIDNFIKNR